MPKKQDAASHDGFQSGVAQATLPFGENGLKRLGAHPRQNGSALALGETGWSERMLFMVNWLELPGLRRQATAELNKGEARNALSPRSSGPTAKAFATSPPPFAPAVSAADPSVISTLQAVCHFYLAPTAPRSTRESG